MARHSRSFWSAGAVLRARRAAVFPLAVVVIASACGRADDAAAIDAARQRMEAAYNARDAEGLAAVLTEDAVFMPPGHPAVEGREQIGAMHRAAFDQSAGEFTSSIEHTSEEVVVAGGWAFDRGTYLATITPAGGGEPEIHGNTYLYVWRREAGGEWKLARAIANPISEAPAHGNEAGSSGSGGGVES